MIDTNGIISKIQEIADYANRQCEWCETRLFSTNTYHTNCGKTLMIELKKGETLHKLGINYCEGCGGRVVVRKGDSKCLEK